MAERAGILAVRRAARAEARAITGRRRIGWGLTLLLAATVISLLMAEVAVRLLQLPDVRRTGDGIEPRGEVWVDPEWRLPPPRAFRLDPVLLVDHEPYFEAPVPVAEHAGKQFKFRTSGYGLRRDSEISVAKPPGVIRVLVLGDSQTDGQVENDETYPARLEQLMVARGQAVEVLNAGVTGYSPQQEYLWYRERGVQLQPDLVVLGFYLGNDILDLIENKLDARVIDDEAGTLNPITMPAAWLSLHSRLVLLAKYASRDERVSAVLERVGLVAPPLVDQDRLARVLRECHGCWLQSGKQALLAREYPAAAEGAYGRLDLLVRLLERQVAAGGGRLVVLLIPSKNQVEPQDERGDVAKMMRLMNLGESDLHYEDVVRERTLAIVEAAGVAVVDPLPELQFAASNGRLYYRRDWHLNPNGNSALAAILDRALEGMRHEE